MTNLITEDTAAGPKKIISFPNGLPGFPACHEFIMAQKSDERPFAWLQSVNDPSVSFAVVDAYAWKKDFAFEIDDSELEQLGSANPMDYAVYFILRIEKGESATTLKAKPNAPVLINKLSRQARQFIVPEAESAEALCLRI